MLQLHFVLHIIEHNSSIWFPLNKKSSKLLSWKLKYHSQLKGVKCIQMSMIFVFDTNWIDNIVLVWHKSFQKPDIVLKFALFNQIHYLISKAGGEKRKTRHHLFILVLLLSFLFLDLLRYVNTQEISTYLSSTAVIYIFEKLIQIEKEQH